MLHIALHFILPLLMALALWWWSKQQKWQQPKQQQWWHNYLWMLGGMVIDLDHLLADPIYDPERCSIGFHPLHSGTAVVFYLVVLVSTWAWPSALWRQRARMVLLGIGIHLILDASDCFI